jgi:hypothetical protein
MILDVSVAAGVSGADPDMLKTLIGTVGAAFTTLITVVGYVIRMNVKLNKSIVEQQKELREVIVQNTVAFKDLQGEIRILSESQRTFLPLLLKEIAR